MIRAFGSIALMARRSVHCLAIARASVMEITVSGLMPLATVPSWMLAAIDMVSKKPSTLRSSVT